MRYKVVVNRDRAKHPVTPYTVQVLRGLPIPGGGGVTSWETIIASDMWFYNEEEALNYGAQVARTDAKQGKLMAEDRAYRRTMELEL